METKWNTYKFIQQLLDKDIQTDADIYSNNI